MKNGFFKIDSGAVHSVEEAEVCLKIHRSWKYFWIREAVLDVFASCLLGGIMAILLYGRSHLALYIGLFAANSIIGSFFEYFENKTYIFYPQSIQVISRQIGNAGVRQYNRVQFENLTFLQNAIEKRMDVGRISFAVERVKHSRFFGDEDIVVLRDVSDFSEVREFLKTHATPLQDEA